MYVCVETYQNFKTQEKEIENAKRYYHNLTWV
jgi:hypothetical protein